MKTPKEHLNNVFKDKELKRISKNLDAKITMSRNDNLNEDLENLMTLND